jgi:hypothetical protein
MPSAIIWGTFVSPNDKISRVIVFGRFQRGLRQALRANTVCNLTNITNPCRLQSIACKLALESKSEPFLRRII